MNHYMKMRGLKRIRRGMGLFVLVWLQSTTLAFGFTIPQTDQLGRTLQRKQDPFTLFATIPRGDLEKEAILKKKPFDIVSAPLQLDFNNATAVETAGMSALGLAFSVAVIYSLASASPLAGDKELESRALGAVYGRVMDAALPRDATDVLSGVLGEAIGGFIGAMSTALVTFTLSLRMEVEKKALLVEAVADGDYFVTKAAALPLLTALGVPEFAAGLASVLLATVPYELVKLNSKRRQQRQSADDSMMDRLFQDQQLEEQKKERGLLYRYQSAVFPSREKQEPVVEAPISQIDNLVDIPEILADVVKWLEFDILRSDFGETLLGPSTNHGLESAVFGFLAGLSSQLYLDFVRTYTDNGPEEKRLEARTRTFTGWVSLYSNECLSTAALFGVYETVKGPVSLFVSGVLSRGVDGCLGSTDVHACLSTYMQDNPAEATLAAQVRSLATVVFSLLDRASLDGGYDAQQFTRAAVVQMYSIINEATVGLSMMMPPDAISLDLLPM